MKRMLNCPYCGSDLKLNIGYDGADWESRAGMGSGFGHVISLNCVNDKCSIVFDLLRVRGEHEVSVVVPEKRHFKYTNL